MRTWFDDYLFVDWSASSRPKAGPDSIWMCSGSHDPDGGLVVGSPVNWRTRQLAFEAARLFLRERVACGRRVLVGFDFAYGLPSGGYSRLLGRSAGWSEYWAELRLRIVDRADNTNNRFEVASELNRGGAGPFWGAPPSRATAALTVTKPAVAAPAYYRRVEEVLRGMGKRPFSPWQLLGNGSVGSQALLGIPWLERLRRDPALACCSVVWPFEPWRRDGALVTHAEIWPAAVPWERGDLVRDAAQVLGVVRWAAAEDLAGRLAEWLDLRGASAADLRAAQTEGWTLGVG